MKLLKILSIIAVVTLAQVTWQSFVLFNVWNWLIAGSFGPSLLIPFPGAVGILMVIRIPLLYVSERKQSENMADCIGFAIFGPAIILLIAYIAKFFI